MRSGMKRPLGDLVTTSLFSLALIAGGCASVPQTIRVSPDTEADISDTTTDSRDLRTVCRTMAESITVLPQVKSAATAPRVAFLSVENRTNSYLDTVTFLEKIRTDLIKFATGKIVFLDRKHSEAILREREAKRSKELAGTKLADRLGADYFLTGVISSIDKQVKRVRSTYTRYAFRLVDAESEAIIWEDDFEVKKISGTAVWNE